MRFALEHHAGRRILAGRRFVVASRVTREAKAAAVGLTSLQLDEECARLKRSGWTERRIAKRYSMAPSAAHYAIERTKGIARKSYSYVMCEGCGEDFTKEQLVDDLCGRCREYVASL
jgi:formylmethanofuran dehydrogenase subunit E